MSTLIDGARFIHAWNAWAVLLVGCIAVGILVVETRRRTWIPGGRRVQATFVGLVHAQVLLGLLAFLGKWTSDVEMFGGNDEKALWHAILGVAAAILVATSYLLRRRGAAYLPVLVTAAAGLVCATLSRLVLVFVLTAACAVLAHVRSSRSDASDPAVPAHPR